ncbi:MAG TPA: hypothetical protein VE912_24325 [Bacteroidales bacterium]|nr:hypothetical protein [Bacteroidales bacterium]
MDNTQDIKAVEYTATGSSAEAIVGIGALVLSILALARVWPLQLGAIAAIAIGTGFLFQGAGIAAKYSRILSRVAQNHTQAVEMKGGFTTEFLGGISGIALGILALLNVAPLVLLSISVIVFGATLLIGSGTTANLNRLENGNDENNQMLRITEEMVKGAAGAQILLGLGSITLGILALVGTGNTMLLSLVALLAIGASEFITGAALSSRMMGIFGIQ